MTIGLAALAWPAGQVSAQDAGTDPVPDIVITSQKRAANVQRVRLSVAVVPADALAKTGGTEFSNLIKLTLGSTMTDAAVVIDNVALAQQAQALTDLVDIERVEVLRGPQSTLFGKSASAGAINVTAKTPPERFTAFAEGKVTDDDGQRGAESLSGPLGR